MPSVPRPPVLARLAALALVASLGACKSSASSGPPAPAVNAVWPGGIPRGRPAVVTLEHALTDPPRLLGLASADHPGLAARDSSFARSGMKRVSVEDMAALLDRLEEQGFLRHGAPIDSLAPLEPGVALRRLAICIDGVTCALTVRRRPDAELVACFNSLSHSVTQLFNATIDLRQEKTDADVFYAEQRHLRDANQTKLKLNGPETRR